MTLKGPELISHEIEVLEMLAGTRPGEWGAWVSACLETLSGAGYCTRGPNYQITEAGRSVLRSLSPALGEGETK